MLLEVELNYQRETLFLTISWADHRVMSETATVRFVQAKMGVSPGWGGGIALTNILGRSKALQMLNGTLKMNGTEAKEFGFVDKTVKSGSAIVKSRELLESYLEAADGSIDAIKGIKKALMVDPEVLKSALLRERDSFLSLWGKDDFQIALKKSLVTLSIKKGERKTSRKSK
jgi:ethylmalonyl-CoA/methylmalonyl-CoA decarboxylase